MLADIPGMVVIDPLIELIDGKLLCEKITQGVYETNLNYRQGLKHLIVEADAFSIHGIQEESILTIGVCDNWEQITTLYPGLVTSERQFGLFLSRWRRDEQPAEGGWRWHKWGPYIGDYRPTTEYLYDEIGIEQVFSFAILEWRPERRTLEFGDPVRIWTEDGTSSRTGWFLFEQDGHAICSLSGHNEVNGGTLAEGSDIQPFRIGLVEKVDVRSLT